MPPHWPRRCPRPRPHRRRVPRRGPRGRPRRHARLRGARRPAARRHPHGDFTALKDLGSPWSAPSTPRHDLAAAPTTRTCSSSTRPAPAPASRGTGRRYAAVRGRWMLAGGLDPANVARRRRRRALGRGRVERGRDRARGEGLRPDQTFHLGGPPMTGRPFGGESQDDFARSVAFTHDFTRRKAGRIVEVPGGFAVLNRPLPRLVRRQQARHLVRRRSRRGAEGGRPGARRVRPPVGQRRRRPPGPGVHARLRGRGLHARDQPGHGLPRHVPARRGTRGAPRPARAAAHAPGRLARDPARGHRRHDRPARQARRAAPARRRHGRLPRRTDRGRRSSRRAPTSTGTARSRRSRTSTRGTATAAGVTPAP